MTTGQDEHSCGAADAEPLNVKVASASARSASKGSSSLLRLRGLPFAASYSDVQSFFAGFETNEIYICRRDGRSTGEAYVVLKTAEDAHTALSRLNKQYIGNRYIELFEAADSDLAAVKKVLEDSRLQGYVVRLRGLPYSATTADVVHFFSGVQLSAEDPAIVFSHSIDGRPTGEAYVELANEEALSLAMMRHKELMGSRYIEIFHSTKVDKLQAQQQAHIHMRSGRTHQQRWPMYSAAASYPSTAGQFAGPQQQGGHTAPVNPSQLADILRSTHITSAGTSRGVNPVGAVPAATYVQSSSYPGVYTGSAMGQTSAGVDPAAVCPAGSGTRVPVAASPLAAAARPSAQPVQLVQHPHGALLMGAEGQAPAMYYVHPPHGVVWGGQGNIPRLAAPVGMMPIVPVTGPAPLVPAAAVSFEAGVEAPTAPVPAGWSQERQQQPPVYNHHARRHWQHG